MKAPDRAIRLDVLIAVCALLVSSLATLASWLQSRESARQTQVLEQQLSAQVWPYVGVSENIDKATVRITIANDGLGPAILENLIVTVDGKAQSNFIDATHALIGTHLFRRRPPRESMGFDLNDPGPGSVLRPGDSSALMTLTSRTYAPLFVTKIGRLQLRVCYCAIIPGKCWVSDTANTSGQATQIARCESLPRDLLHSTALPSVRAL